MIFEILLISISSYLIFSLITKKKNILVTHIKIPHQRLAGSKNIPQIGGIIFILNIFFYHDYFYGEIFFCLSLLILGILSDIDLLSSPLKRLLIQIIILFSFTYYNDLYISDLKIDILNDLLLNNDFKFIFITFCFLILVNGSNFIDGCDGLNIGYFAIVIFIILYCINYYDLEYDFLKLELVFIIITAILILNLFKLIYLGDSGAYVISFIVGALLIDFYKTNNHITPYFIAILLWYPAFENLFSIIRKKINKENATDPDTLHLHQLLFRFLSAKLKNLKEYSNPLTSIIINFYNLFVFLVAVNFYTQTKLLVLILIINVIIYLLIYKILSTKNKINSNQ